MEAFEGASPIFGILASYEEWNIFAFDDIISREVLFDSVEESNENLYTRTSDYRIVYDDENDECVVRNLISAKSIAGSDPNLLRYLVSIMIKCFNRQTNCSKSNPLISLLKTDRIVLKVMKASISWIKIPKSLQMLTLSPPSFNDKRSILKELLLLRDFREGRDGKAWLGCSKAGNLVVLKFCKGNRKETKAMNRCNSFSVVEEECNIWNKLYGTHTSKALELDNQLVLVMPVVICCIYDKKKKETRFNCTLQPSKETNLELLNLDLKQVKELQFISDNINHLCNPTEIALKIFNRLAEKRLIHLDIAWRHIGVRPIYKNKNEFVCFEPTVIDLSSVEPSTISDTKEEIINKMMIQLRKSEEY